MDGFPQIVATTRDILTIVCAVIASYVALMGLSTWRRQLRGNTQYDLARRLLLSAYKLRDAVEGVRTPGIHSVEVAHALKETGVSTDGRSQRDSVRLEKVAVYEVRWRRVQDAKSELSVNCFEAQVLWGEEAKAAYQAINSCVQKLWAAIVMDMEFEARGVTETDLANMLDRKKILSPMVATPEDDEYMVELNRSIQRLDDLVKPHLVLD